MSIHSGISPECLTSTYVENLLQYIFKDDSLRVNNFKVRPGSSAGDNYACQILRITCDYVKNKQKDSLSIIAKNAPSSVFGKGRGLSLVQREVKMLSETLPLLYAELCRKIETEPFFPIFYQTDADNNIFFIEDLKTDGYTLVDKKLSLDLDHVTLVIKTLAKMHASSYLLFTKNPDYKNNYLNHSWKRSPGGGLERISTGMSKCLKKSLHLWPIGEEDKEIFRKIKFYDLMVDSYERKESSFNVLLHGDCWTNNLMFRYKNGKPISVKFVDYQISNYNSIGLDLNYFLFTSSRENVKLEHLEDIFKIYYKEFIRITGEIEGFTIDTVCKEFTERIGFGFCMACLYRPANILETPMDLAAYLQNKESESNDKMYEAEIYIQEVVKLLPLFKKYGVFK